MEFHAGYLGKILWVNLTHRTSRLEQPHPNYWRTYMGGGLLATKLLLDHTPAGMDPFDDQNLLIFTTSVVSGHAAPGLSRFTTASKSPLTFGIGETRTEGPFAMYLKKSGVDTLVIKGRSNTPVNIIVSESNVQFVDASALWGKGTGETTAQIKSQLGNDVGVAAIGPAGENRVRFSSIVTEYGHQVARMGMGAVMGSKNLKAVILKGQELPKPAKPEIIKSCAHIYEQSVEKNSLTKWQKESPGFSDWIYLHGLDAALCVNNYSLNDFEHIDNYKTEHFLVNSISISPCPGCPNNCIKAIIPQNRTLIDSRQACIHQEISGTMGPNLGIKNLDFVLESNIFCNDMGLDPTSLGYTLSFAAELFSKGILSPSDNDGHPLEFGNEDGFWKLMHDIVYRKGLGSVLAEGTKRAAEEIGGTAIQYAMQVKGLEMVCFEPRSQTNLALGYAFAPVGPRYDICEHDWDFDTHVGWDHSLDLARTLGILERIPMNYLGLKKLPYFKSLFTIWSAADVLDMCIFAIAPTRILTLDQMSHLIQGITGWETSAYELMKVGSRRIHLMRLYNMREGMSKTEDTLPDRFFSEPIQSGARKGDVLDRNTFHEMIAHLYKMFGWNEAGIPETETLYDHQLETL